MDTLFDQQHTESRATISAHREPDSKSPARRAQPVERGPFTGLRWLIGFWMALVLGGMLILAYHASVPGKAAQPPRRVIVDLPGGRPAGKALLLLFIHPKCPCSRATLGELAKIVSRRERRLDTRVFFYRPAGFPAGWERTDLWHMAEGIPGVLAMVDADGTVAERFRVKTSGQALLYDEAGRLVFSGGITPTRGHAGDNPGESAIVSWLATGRSPPKTAAVFGCSLAGESQIPEKEPENGRAPRPRS
jgi:hypothetical protein